MRHRDMATALAVSIWLCGTAMSAGCKGEAPEAQPPKPRAPVTSRVTTLPYYDEASFTPRWIDPQDVAGATIHTIPDFTLTNQLGETITQETFAGKIYISDFFFTTCRAICLDMTVNMAKLQDEFVDDDQVVFLSHSVTPDVDTVEVLKAYGEARGVKPGKWHLATGDRAQIYELGRRHYFIEEDQGEMRSDDEFLHTENFVLIDEHRHIRGIYNGLNDTALAQLVADVRTLQAEHTPKK